MNMIIHHTILLATATLVFGHGRVTWPLSRASAWRYDNRFPRNDDDNGMNCGGQATQWSVNGGKCGICGDAYNLPKPRPHEFGGTNYLGVILATFLPGSTINITTDLTAPHKGYWQFSLCPDHTSNNQKCFDRHTLDLENGGTKFYPKGVPAIYKLNYKLPAGLVCEHCVLQWRYVAGNSWGTCSNGTQGLGCGGQEEFRACSDIAIGKNMKGNNANTIKDNSLDRVSSPRFSHFHRRH